MQADLRNFYESTLPYSWRENLYRLTKLNYYRFFTTNADRDRLLQDFDNYQCIFIHVPKTGGMSIRKTLFGKSNLYPHLTIRNYQRLLPEQKVNGYYKFAFVRNPWDRLVSAYSFLRAGGLNERGKRWESQLSKYQSFDCFVKDWVNPRNVQKHIVLVPQSEFVCDVRGNIAVDYLARFEQFNLDFEQIQTKLNTNFALKHINRSQRQDYRDYYTDESRAIVEKVYARDIINFDYQFD